MNSDIQRILDLPRAEYPDGLAETMTSAIRAPGGEWSLREEQAQLLFAAAKYRGAVGGLGVGLGKTLATMLLPWALGLESKDVLVLLPASLRDEAHRERAVYEEHFDLPPMPRYMSYAKLSDPDSVRLLDELAPKAIICDEAHYLRNRKSARTRRFLRYMRRNPDTIYVPMSGTFTGGRIFDYAHLWRLALGKGCPLPRTYTDAESWSRVLDVDSIEPPTAFDYRLVEPLKQWAKEDNARRALYARLSTAPGVVLSSSASSDVPIRVVVDRRSPGATIEAAIADTEQSWVLPDGDTEVLDQLRLATALRQVSLGFFLRWTWPKAGAIDRKWLKKRSDYYREISTITRRGKEGYETIGLVERALAADPPDPYIPADLRRAAAAWHPIRDRCDPEPEAVWFERDTLGEVVEGFGDEGIIWYRHRAVADELARLGVPVAYAGEDVPDAPLVGLSISSHGTGLNLQRFSRNLVLEPPANAGTWEQMIGRTARAGQTAEEVVVHVYARTEPTKKALTRARARARYVSETTGMSQALVRAEYREIKG